MEHKIILTINKNDGPKET